MLVALRNGGSGMGSSDPAAATSGGSLQSAHRASHSEGPEGATSDSDSVFVDGAESSSFVLVTVGAFSTARPLGNNVRPLGIVPPP